MKEGEGNRRNLEGFGGRRDLCQEESTMHSRQSNVTTTRMCEKMAYLEGGKSLPLALRDERAEGRLGTRGRWAGSGITAGAHSCRGSDVPPQPVRMGWEVSWVRTAGKGGEASWRCMVMP